MESWVFVGEFEVGILIWWWVEILFGLVVFVELIVSCLFFWVGKYGVGFVDFLYVFFGIWFFGYVWMVFVGEFVKSFFDVICCFVVGYV